MFLSCHEPVSKWIHFLWFLECQEFLARSRCEISSLSNCNGTRTHNHSALRRTLNHLAKLAKLLSCVVSTYLYSASDCMFLSCHVRLNFRVTLHCADKYPQHSSVIWPVWLNDWVFAEEQGGCGFNSRCIHLKICDFLVFTMPQWATFFKHVHFYYSSITKV